METTEIPVDFAVNIDRYGHRYLTPVSERARDYVEEQIALHGEEGTVEEGALVVENRNWADYALFLREDGFTLPPAAENRNLSAAW